MADPAPDKAKKIATFVYALYAASLIVGVTAIVGVIVAHIRKDDAAGTWLDSHFRWQIRTFWFGLAWAMLGAILFLMVIGWFVLAAVYFWFIYRIVKGWLRLYEDKPMYTGTATTGR
jgi:uncharacterized membrane protein